MVTIDAKSFTPQHRSGSSPTRTFGVIHNQGYSIVLKKYNFYILLHLSIANLVYNMSVLVFLELLAVYTRVWVV